ncbi:MAG: formate/nitrite transporter family protein [Pseudomonadota bacterium]
MDYVKPANVVENMIDSAASKGRLSIMQMLLRGSLSGALLGIATSLAIGANIQSGQPIVGALVFPVGFVMICLLGLELVTGSFALLPLGAMAGKINITQVLKNWVWVFLGNLIGSMAYAALLSIVLTNNGATPPNAVGQAIIKIAEAKTNGYAAYGGDGMLTVFVKAMLCNWMVCLGIVMFMVSTNTIGKIVAAWMPIVVFFAQGFEHAVVNMFVIPAGMLMGAHVSISDWWYWNQIPVTAGNIVGGLFLTGIALFLCHRQQPTAQITTNLTPIAEEVVL